VTRRRRERQRSILRHFHYDIYVYRREELLDIGDVTHIPVQAWGKASGMWEN